MWEKKVPPTWDSATGAEQYERLLWNEVKQGNWREVEKRLAATYVALTPQGVLDRAGMVVYFQGLDLTDFTLGDVQVVPNGNDMVVSYRLTLLRQEGASGRPPSSASPTPSSVSQTFLMMTIWQQHEGGWIAIAHSQLPQ